MKKVEDRELRKVLMHKQNLVRGLSVPVDALPGSLSVSAIRCGKKNCHCSEGKKHEAWTLTYMVEGKKHVRHIPQDLVEYVRQRVTEGKNFRETLNAVLSANVQLLALRRKQKRRT